jgi:uncharacterized membrane protein (TIGR02234 family)
MVLALGLILAGAAVVVFGASRTWLTAAWVVPDFPAVRIQKSGGEVAPLVRAAGFVALAGVVALLATRRRGRLVVGAVVLLAGAAVVVGCVLFQVANEAEADAALAKSVADPTLTVHATALSTTAWPYPTAVGGLLVVAGGLVTLLRSAGWPAMGARYDAPNAPARRTDSDPWAALDRGEDPTTHP